MMRCHAEEEAYAAEAHAAVTGLRVLMIAKKKTDPDMAYCQILVLNLQKQH